MGGRGRTSDSGASTHKASKGGAAYKPFQRTNLGTSSPAVASAHLGKMKGVLGRGRR